MNLYEPIDSLFEADTSDETLSENSARGGSLSESGRIASIRVAIGLVGRYFAAGSQSLVPYRSISRQEHAGQASDQHIHILLAALRLRVALAAAGRLRNILQRIISRMSFRYELQSFDSIGDLTGQLDINRYIAQLGSYGEFRSYPILEARRANHTPENLLAAYSSEWILRELHAAYTDSDAIIEGPESRKLQFETREISRLLRSPGLSACRKRIANLSKGSERQLISATKRRIRRREVPNSTPYSEMVNWVERSLEGVPVADPGDIEWSYYGDRFDTKLFEIWCLEMVAREVSRQLAVKLPDVDVRWRSGGPTYTWRQLGGTISLYFQCSPPSISSSYSPRWRRADEQKSLGGVPDIVAYAVRHDDRSERLLVIDPKLRQRGGPPTEELYKILGYIHNFGISKNPSGAVLYHTTETDSLPSFRYNSPSDDGKLFAIAVNPGAPDISHNVLAPVGTAILDLLDLPPLHEDNLTKIDTASSSEEAAESYVRARVKELSSEAKRIPKVDLDSSRRRVRALIGEKSWIAVPGEVQTMLATSEHIGFSLADEGDFSGPSIGICASIEYILYQYTIGPAMGSHPELASKCRTKTFGQIVAMLDKLQHDTGRFSPENMALASYLSDQNISLSGVGDLIEPLREMNKRYRIPAAHRDTVDERTWRRAWNMVIGSNGLLVRTIRTLVPSHDVND